VCAYALKFKVHCGSTFEPGASGLPSTPHVCVPNWRMCGDETTKKMESSVTQKNLTWSNWTWWFVTKTFESKNNFFFWESPSSPWSFFWNPERWVSTANCTPFMGHGTVTVISRTALRTVSLIIISEMEMWRCPDYLFTVAENRGGLI